MTFFEARRTPEGEVFIPLPDAASRWTGTHVRGPAITSLLARAIEQALPGEVDLLPARSTFDLHGQVPMVSCRTRARVVKRGRTLWIVESELYAGETGTDRPLARCRAALVTPIAEDAALSEESPASVWAAPLAPECTPPPPEMRVVSAQGRLYRSRATEWTGDRAAHQDAHRNLVWYYDEPIIAGEAPTPYQLAARVSDLGNYVINYGAQGLSHINTDATLALARLPEPGGIGLAGELRAAHAGVSTGTAILFDAAGMCGTSTVTAVQHTKTRLTYR